MTKERRVTIGRMTKGRVIEDGEEKERMTSGGLSIVEAYISFPVVGESNFLLAGS
jgi:hypothetical protein